MRVGHASGVNRWTVCRRNLFPIGPSSDGGKPCEPRMARPYGKGATHTSGRLGTVVRTACRVALFRSKRGARETPDTYFLSNRDFSVEPSSITTKLRRCPAGEGRGEGDSCSPRFVIASSLLAHAFLHTPLTLPSPTGT